jgi:hypothetical protein
LLTKTPALPGPVNQSAGAPPVAASPSSGVWSHCQSRLESHPLFPAAAPVASEPLIEIKDVNFAYAERPILTGINMSIPRG